MVQLALGLGLENMDLCTAHVTSCLREHVDPEALTSWEATVLIHAYHNSTITVTVMEKLSSVHTKPGHNVTVSVQQLTVSHQVFVLQIRHPAGII